MKKVITFAIKANPGEVIDVYSSGSKINLCRKFGSKIRFALQASSIQRGLSSEIINFGKREITTNKARR